MTCIKPTKDRARLRRVLVKKEDAERLVGFLRTIERNNVWSFAGTTSTHKGYTAKINKKETMLLKLMFDNITVKKLKR